MRKLDRVLPDEIKNRSVWCGDELVLPYGDALAAIEFANQHSIAVLGLEAFEVQKEGLLTVGLADASSYIQFTGDWKAYVARMNQEAEQWIRQHRLGENHGYILSSASASEFAALSARVR